jgi:hypothetical protein
MYAERALFRLPRSHFIVGPLYDAVLFVFAPLLALGIGVFLSATHLSDREWTFGGTENEITNSLIGVFIHAHLFVVFFRSHLNGQIRRLYPTRFLLVPPVMLAGALLSRWVLVGISVLATFWDVYHSGLQTFGLGRIYDARAGNNPKTARMLDVVLNHLLYAGPIVAGATMMAHFEDFHEFDNLTPFFDVVPAFMETNQRYFAWALLVGGVLFLGYYVYYYVNLVRQGYVVSWPKVALLVSTGFCSIYSWGFNTWGEAFLIMNFFHALQYFALVWWKEQGNMARLFRTARLRAWKPLTLGLFVFVGIAYGVVVEATPTSVPLIYPLSLVVSIMHFWYDGFVWSVQRRQV